MLRIRLSLFARVCAGPAGVRARTNYRQPSESRFEIRSLRLRFRGFRAPAGTGLFSRERCGRGIR